MENRNIICYMQAINPSAIHSNDKSKAGTDIKRAKVIPVSLLIWLSTRDPTTL